jgi:hypothetical protein
MCYKKGTVWDWIFACVTHRSWRQTSIPTSTYHSITCKTGKEQESKHECLCDKLWDVQRDPHGCCTSLFSYGLFNGALCTSVLRRAGRRERKLPWPLSQRLPGALRKLTKNRSQHNRCRGTDKSKHCHFSQFDEEGGTSVYAKLHYFGMCHGTVW